MNSSALLFLFTLFIESTYPTPIQDRKTSYIVTMDQNHIIPSISDQNHIKQRFHFGSFKGYTIECPNMDSFDSHFKSYPLHDYSLDESIHLSDIQMNPSNWVQ